LVPAAEEADWRVGSYQIEDDGWEDASHWLVVRGAAEVMGDNPDSSGTPSKDLYPLRHPAFPRPRPGYYRTEFNQGHRGLTKSSLAH